MFLNFFFLILILLLIGSAPTIDEQSLFPLSIEMTMIASAVIYTTTITLIYLQSRFWRRPFGFQKDRLTTLINIELIIMLIVLYFGVGMQRLFFIPLFFPFSLTALTITSLSLYSLGIAVGHYSYQRHWNPFHPVRPSVIFLIPFTIPFLIFVFINDASEAVSFAPLLNFLGVSENETAQIALAALGGLACICLIIILLPPLIIKLWSCQPLKDPALVARLESLCQRAHFTHAGFKVWSIMDGVLTAAILGVLGPLRYVIFTSDLLQRLSPEAIEAILAHEIGHSRHKHLLIYPFILAGVGITWTLFLLLSGEVLIKLPEFAILILFAINAWLYFRFVFGYFSRLFERQADLMVFELGLPSENLIEAFSSLGGSSESSRRAPNWHHFSIQERIDFLQSAQNDPKKILLHQRKVCYSLIFYFVISMVALFVIKGFI